MRLFALPCLWLASLTRSPPKMPLPLLSPAARVVFSTWFALGAFVATAVHAAVTGGFAGNPALAWARADSLWFGLVVSIVIGLVGGYAFYWGLGFFSGMGRRVVVNRPQSAAFLAGGATFFIARGVFSMLAGLMGPSAWVAAGGFAASSFFIAAAYLQWFTRQPPRDPN
jgi:hypothetical protein